MLIFISYSSANRALVHGLVEVLEGFGHEVWFDQELSGGHMWWDEILNRIRQCDLFIFALSPESFDSYPCKLEYTYGHQLGKRILPVLLVGVNTTLLPPILSEVQFVDYRQQDTKATIGLGRALNMLPPPLPLPEPLPSSPKMPVSPLGKLKDQIDTPTLSFEEQTAILSQLKELLSRGEKPENVLELLEHLQERSDLFAVIDREINTITKAIRGSLKSAHKSWRGMPSVPKMPSTPSFKSTFSGVKAGQGRVRRFFGWLSRVPGWLWRNLIVRPLTWLWRFIKLLLFGRPLTFRSLLWRYAFVTVVVDLVLGLFTSSYIREGGVGGLALSHALVIAGFIIAGFFILRVVLGKWVFPRQTTD